MEALKVTKREVLKKKVKKLRKEGKVPAVLYGPDILPLNLLVKKEDLKKFLKEIAEGQLGYLELEEEKIPVIIKEIQKHPLSGEILHLDFYRPSLKEAIETEVPLEFVNQAPAQSKGAFILKQLTEIPIEALAFKIPKSIKVDLSLLKEIDDKICVKDLEFPEGVRPLISSEVVIALASKVEAQASEEKPLSDKEISSEQK